MFSTEIINIYGQNNCEVEFNVNIKRNDTITIFSIDKKTKKYWTQNKFENICIYMMIDRSLIGYSRINKIKDVIINDGEDFYNDSTLDKLNLTYSNLWIENKYLNTDFDEWVFLSNETSLNNLNIPFLYSKPSTISDKKAINPKDYWEIKNDNSIRTLYNIETLECSGKWLKIKIKTNKKEEIGWMPWYNFCPNILTNCHHLPVDGVKNEE